ncbi:sulfatase-like hydrolase/transferase [Jannaschia aquimarina]|uniref:Arylsulfatase n=1 Tax=Jannaschia aquimarina TaxID=935700 RepID=A0A0D1EDK9_9RHOB|nr:sulfatase-like hydrolase/transferase [Jannaschia aquimarina]KIT15031.1 Arylsulfatase [Jannaschia aquimarina]SNS62358.1 Arylsulfatase A [Jannaschia aquimarina]
MTTHPNVLLVMSDQQRPDTLGFRGETPCRTPHMDRLAREGVSFDRAMTPCPLCLPSRAALFTGLYPHENDMLDNTTSALETCQLLETFRGGGYEVSYAGKWHLGQDNIDRFTDRAAGDSTALYSDWCKERGLVDGWTFNDPRVRTHRQPSMSTPVALPLDMAPETTNDAYIADIAIDHLRTRDRSRPFFQVCSFNGPHPPFVIPEPYFSMYDPADAVRPPNFGPRPGEPAANETSYYRRLFLDHGEDFEAWRKSYAVYWGFTSLIDDQLGRILNALEAEGTLDDTIVIYLSDHGENLGAHGLWHKMVGYEESIRVPLIFRLPGRISNGLRSDMPSSLVDVAPTLARLCDLPSRPEWRGRDLSGVMAGEEAPDLGREMFAMHRPLGDWMGTVPWRMIEADRKKLIWHLDGAVELFDLEADPFELNDLAASPGAADLRRDLLARLHDLMAEVADPRIEDFAAIA